MPRGSAANRREPRSHRREPGAPATPQGCRLHRSGLVRAVRRSLRRQALVRRCSRDRGYRVSASLTVQHLPRLQALRSTRRLPVPHVSFVNSQRRSERSHDGPDGSPDGRTGESARAAPRSHHRRSGDHETPRTGCDTVRSARTRLVSCCRCRSTRRSSTCDRGPAPVSTAMVLHWSPRALVDALTTDDTRGCTLVLGESLALWARGPLGRLAQSGGVVAPYRIACTMVPLCHVPLSGA